MDHVALVSSSLVCLSRTCIVRIDEAQSYVSFAPIGRPHILLAPIAGRNNMSLRQSMHESYKARKLRKEIAQESNGRARGWSICGFVFRFHVDQSYDLGRCGECHASALRVCAIVGTRRFSSDLWDPKLAVLGSSSGHLTIRFCFPSLAGIVELLQH